MSIDWSKLRTREEIEAEQDPAYVDQQTLDAALVAEGSIVRALVILTFEEINKLRAQAGLAEYTLDQFKTALKAKMR